MTDPVAQSGLNPAQQEAILSALKLFGVSALGGAGLRTAIAAARPPVAADPEPSKPLVVSIPRPRPPGTDPTPVKYALDDAGADVSPIAALLQRIPFFPDVGLSKFLNENRLGAYTSLWGANAKTPAEVPVFTGLAAPAAIVGGGVAGYAGASGLLDKARRMEADRQVAKARRGYEDEVLRRFGGRKQAAPGDAGVAAAVSAIEDLYDAVAAKEANETGTDLLTSVFMPGTRFGPGGTAANLAVMGLLGGLGAASGYRYSRDDLLADQLRNEVSKSERDAQEESRPVIVAKFVPPPAPRVSLLKRVTEAAKTPTPVA